MNIIVIGSTGFIGQHLIKYLIEKGYSVDGADILSTTICQTNYLLEATNTNYKSIFQKTTYGFCINCSGAASVPESIANPQRDYLLNTVNVSNILLAIKEFQPNCKFINLSSAAVYGNPKALPIKETSELDPVSPYGTNKLLAEKLCDEFHHLHGLQTCSLRIFSAYGEGLQKQLFWDLYKKASTNSPFTLFGTGNESRDFIYILDLVKCIELCMLNSHFKSDVINIANGKEIFIKEAVNTFFSNFNREIDYSFAGEERKGDPNNWVADISRLQSMGYKTEFDITHGLKRYYNWICELDK